MSQLPQISRNGADSSVAMEMRAALKRWNIEPVAFKAQVDIQHEGDTPQAMYLVKSGWIYSYASLENGQRQVLFLHQVGDIAGLENYGVMRVGCSLRSLGDCVVLPIPITAVASEDFLRPDIVMYFLQKSAQVHSILMRTLIAVGRMEARHRIVWLILMLQDRLLHSEAKSSIIEMPFNQSEIGDFIGLTNVSVSKMLCQLSDEGYIERKGNKILIRRRADMQSMVNYENMGFSTDNVATTDASRIP